ncbi:MAG: carboxylase [Spirochaetes bacterium]|nr:carboxylase [Spirochaetota bacterium]
MAQKLLIRDITLRDGQQSLFATRMNQAQVDRVLPMYKNAKFYAMEVWGGAVPDSIMRFLKENPWERLHKIKETIGDISKLTALSRGRNLFGYNPYPDTVIEGFCRNAIKTGIDIMRIFDALNDINNMKASIKFVKENGGMADCAVCYTVDPHLSIMDRIKYLLEGRWIPLSIFPIKYFVEKAKALESLGADMITIKDMAGLITPEVSQKLIKALKANVKIPIDLHTHCTPGFGLASIMVAIVNGVDIVDTAMMTFGGGAAAPGYELIRIFTDKLGIDTGVDAESVAAINKELRSIRTELAKFDEYKSNIPIEFDIAKDKLPPEIDKLFDQCVTLAKAGNMQQLLDVTHKIEAYFNYPKPDDAVRLAQIPGGMYTNMIAQMKEAKQEAMFDRVLQVVPKVRVDAGCPPLVTPTSQIVGAQAVNCVIDETKEKPFYTNNSKNFVDLVKGWYGKTPIPVSPKFREKITGNPIEAEYDTSKYQKQANPKLKDCGGLLLAKDEKEELLLELFPNVANDFLKGVREKEYAAMPKVIDYEARMWDELALSMA